MQVSWSQRARGGAEVRNKEKVAWMMVAEGREESEVSGAEGGEGVGTREEGDKGRVRCLGGAGGRREGVGTRRVRGVRERVGARGIEGVEQKGRHREGRGGEGQAPGGREGRGERQGQVGRGRC